MGGKTLVKNTLVFGIILLFIVSAVSPMVIGLKSDTVESVVEREALLNNLAFYYYDISDSLNQKYIKEQFHKTILTDEIQLEELTMPIQPIKTTSGGPMDSPWPMYCHDVRHTGRSPYSTVDTWNEMWRFRPHLDYYVCGSPVVGDDGTVYFGGLGDFYALSPNGTVKWKYDGLDFYVWSASAIDENGTIYIGDLHGYFYAINLNGTLKWRIKTCIEILSSPAIAEDGTIYFGDDNKYINALWSNGTLRWRYKTGHVVYSSPAIGEDGTVYCGSHDKHLYALYPNNGTLKWKYKTGDWVRVSPCIADDGTIYVVSFDCHLYALYPNGTLKWKTNMGEAGTSPTIGQDGMIYAGYTKLRAFYPDNGSVKWTFDPGKNRRIRGATPCHSAEDIIFFGTHIGDYGGGEIIAVNPDGTERWRKKIANEYVDSAPAIGEDGTIYIGSASDDEGNSYGYLHAFGIGELETDANGPYYGLINEPVQFQGKAGGGYSPHTFHWDFGDGHVSEEQNPTHIYKNAGNYTVNLTVTDNSSNTSSDTTWAWIQESNDPPNKPSITGETNGKVGTKYDYTFVTTDPEGLQVWYYIEWGDDTDTGWIGPYPSGKEITMSHKWSEKGNYTICCKAKDPYDAESDWAYLEVTMPKNQQSQNMWYPGWLERFPILNQIVNLLMEKWI